MAEYGSMFIVGVLAAILFFGGWHGPIPVAGPIGQGVGMVLGDWAGQYVTNLIGCCNLIGKGCLAVVVMIWVRWTFPRLRIDQVITVCWKYCVPIAAVCFLGVLGWEYFGLPNAGEWFPGPSANEHWSVATDILQPAAEASAVLTESAGGSS